MSVQRGDIYYADLSPVVGSEQGGIRPVLIVQNDVGNYHSPTVIVAPLTSRSGVKATQPTHVLIQAEILKYPSIILLEQLRTIDKRRFEEYVGRLDRKTMQLVDGRILTSLGITLEDGKSVL